MWDFYPGSAGIFWRLHDHFRRFLKKSEVFRRIPKSSENVRSPSPSLRTRMNASSPLVLFTSKIRDRMEGIVIYSFYTWFLYLNGSDVTYFWKLCLARWRQLTFFHQAWEIGPQAWDSIMPKVWELAGIIYSHVNDPCTNYFRRLFFKNGCSLQKTYWVLNETTDTCI